MKTTLLKPGTFRKKFAALLVLLAPGCFATGVSAQESADRPGNAKQETVQDAVGASPELNEGFLDPNMSVDDWVARFELESREIFASRDEVYKHLKLEAGNRVADIGAGTGFFTRMFAATVGDSGQVYAVDISPRFLEHIAAESEKTGQRNVTPVLASAKCCNLPPDSVDMVFICDTYHHFEHPGPTLESIFRAMVPGGRLFVIDFERIPGKSRPWLLDHVRADKETFRSEIESAGFQFTEEIRISTFSENYFLVFQRPVSTQEAIDRAPQGDWKNNRRR